MASHRNAGRSQRKLVRVGEARAAVAHRRARGAVAAACRTPGGRVRWYRSPWRIAWTAIRLAVTFAAVGAIVAIFVIPRVMDGSSLTVLTGSMRPTLNPGDVVVVRGISQEDVCREVKVGQIVTYLPEPNDPSLITHRVVGKTVGTFDDKTACRLITQGDANSAVDAPVSPAQVRGTFLYGVPKLGWARQWVDDHLRLIVLASGALALGYLVWSRIRRPKTTSVTYVLPATALPAEGPAHSRTAQ